MELRWTSADVLLVLGWSRVEYTYCSEIAQTECRDEVEVIGTGGDGEGECEEGDWDDEENED